MAVGETKEFDFSFEQINCTAQIRSILLDEVAACVNANIEMQWKELLERDWKIIKLKCKVTLKEDFKFRKKCDLEEFEIKCLYNLKRQCLWEWKVMMKEVEDFFGLKIEILSFFSGRICN